MLLNFDFVSYETSKLLPQKFKIDKRKLHLSAYILAGLKSREEALQELEQPIYPVDRVNEDTEYMAKKFDISLDDYESIMESKPKTFLDYKTRLSMAIPAQHPTSQLVCRKLVQW